MRRRCIRSVSTSAKFMGIIAYFIIDRIITIFSNANELVQFTLKNLEETNDNAPNWIKWDSKTKKWELGGKFKQLLSDTNPSKSQRKVKKVVEEAIKDISEKDLTGWFTKIYRFMSTSSTKKPVEWIKKILLGIPCESNPKDEPLPKSELSKFRTETQIKAVKNELHFGFDTISKYVGPNVVEPSWDWR